MTDFLRFSRKLKSALYKRFSFAECEILKNILKEKGYRQKQLSSQIKFELDKAITWYYLKLSQFNPNVNECLHLIDIILGEKMMELDSLNRLEYFRMGTIVCIEKMKIGEVVELVALYSHSALRLHSIRNLRTLNQFELISPKTQKIYQLNFSSDAGDWIASNPRLQINWKVYLLQLHKQYKLVCRSMHNRTFQSFVSNFRFEDNRWKGETVFGDCFSEDLFCPPIVKLKFGAVELLLSITPLPKVCIETIADYL